MTEFFLSSCLGVAPQLTDITSCIGDTVNYTCTVNAVGHAWNISSPAAVVAITRTVRTTSILPYGFMLTEDDGNSITSTLSLTVFAGFNGAVITCLDANALPGEGDKQSTTAMVFGECCITYNVVKCSGAVLY